MTDPLWKLEDVLHTWYVLAPTEQEAVKRLADAGIRHGVLEVSYVGEYIDTGIYG